MKNQNLYAHFLAWCEAGKSLFFGVVVQQPMEPFLLPEEDSELNLETDPDLNDNIRKDIDIPR